MTTTQETVSEETFDEAVARRVRGLMGERRITQQALASALGMGKASMSRRLSGEMEFSLSEVPAVAAALRTTPEYLILGALDASLRSTPGYVANDDEVVEYATVLPFRSRRAKVA